MKYLSKAFDLFSVDFLWGGRGKHFNIFFFPGAPRIKYAGARGAPTFILVVRQNWLGTDAESWSNREVKGGLVALLPWGGAATLTALTLI